MHVSVFLKVKLVKKYMQKRGKKDLKIWGNEAANQEVRWLQKWSNGQPTKKWKMAAKKQGKQAQKSAKKWPQKMPKNAENWGERGQPTKKEVGCKIIRNRTARQREEWLQIKRPKEGSQQVWDGCKKMKERGAKRGKKEEQKESKKTREARMVRSEDKKQSKKRQ